MAQPVVRAKAYVAKLEHAAWNEGGLIVTLQAVTRGEENRQWALATPNLTFTMTIKNPIAADVFHEAMGKEFYVDFTPVGD